MSSMTHFRHYTGLAAGFISLAVNGLVSAAPMNKVDVAGFLSTVYSVTDEAAFFEGDETTGINEDGSFQGTKLGLNLRAQVSDTLTVASQLFGSIQDDSYHLHLDWAFASFKLSPEWHLRTGKIKYPVGLVNEYVDVGIAYPWISAPAVIYSENANGPQATREAYTGYSFLWNHHKARWSFDLDLFGGQVDLENMRIKQLLGVTGRANWNDIVDIQLSTYNGEMKISMMPMMNNKNHGATTLGVKADWNNIVAYAETAQVDMDVQMMGVEVGDSDAWYATLGYRFNNWLPHVTFQNWEQDDGDGHEITSYGLNYHLSSRSVLKAEFSTIDTTTSMGGSALFETAPSSNETNLYRLAVDVVF